MATNQVVLYFDKQEDALLFAVAASSIMSPEEAIPNRDAGVRVAGDDGSDRQWPGTDRHLDRRDQRRRLLSMHGGWLVLLERGFVLRPRHRLRMDPGLDPSDVIGLQRHADAHSHTYADAYGIVEARAYRQDPRCRRRAEPPLPHAHP